MKLYNTLSRKVEPIKPLNDKVIKLYTCGPTVYHYMHIGNLRKAIFDDLLKRVLLATGYKVNHVMNITDVGHLSDDADHGEDKLEKRAKSEKKTVWDIAKYYTDCALADYDAVNVLEPTKIVKATDTIKEQVKFIKGLEDKGFAYKGELGVYFDTSKSKDYGKLSGQKLEEKEVAVRKDVVIDSSKRNPHDFALWVFTKGKHANHSMRWNSPWGEGFPGWHLECSTIIKKELGNSIDIHTGGVDLIGTHHTNEIAQSEALHSASLSNHWMHTEFLHVDGRKMAKSLDNTYRIIELEEHGFSRFAFRLLILQSHYRSQQNFTWEALKAAQTNIKNIYAAADLRFQPSNQAKPAHPLNKFRGKILASLQNDLDSPSALAEVNELFDTISRDGVDKGNQKEIQNFIAWLDDTLGLGLSQSSDISPSLKKQIKRRDELRENSKFAESDKMRRQLEADGIGLRDTKFGTVWYRL